MSVYPHFEWYTQHRKQDGNILVTLLFVDIELLRYLHDCNPRCTPETANPYKYLIYMGFTLFVVVWGGIEPPTQGFSVLCSTN